MLCEAPQGLGWEALHSSPVLISMSGEFWAVARATFLDLESELLGVELDIVEGGAGVVPVLLKDRDALPISRRGSIPERRRWGSSSRLHHG